MAQNNPTAKTDTGKPSAARAFMVNDLPLIRKSLIVLVICLSSSASLIVASKALQLKMQDSQSQTLVQRNESNNKLRQAENDRQEIHDYQPKFLALRKQGFVGEERRLDWVESIKRIQEDRKLLAINYEISAQQVIPPEPEIALGDLELRSSQMKLKMDLLHEGDLLNFMNDLRRKGLYTVQGCKVSRLEGESESVHSPLTAECIIFWLTLGEPSNSQEPKPQ